MMEKYDNYKANRMERNEYKIRMSVCKREK